MALSYYEQPNFEMLLHLAETVLAYHKADESLGANDRTKPAFGAFTNIMPHWAEFAKQGRAYDVRHFVDQSVELIANRLLEIVDGKTDEDLAKLRAFLFDLRSRFDLMIASLNYDDLVERAIGNWIDGFIEDNGIYRFVARSLLQPSADPVLLHLHGSVRWYVPLGDEATRGFEILRADNGAYASKPSRRRTIDTYSQSGDPIVVGPMIAGLRKTDKIAVEPFATYQWKLKDSLLRNERLMIIGYGGWDSYLTTALQEFVHVHGKCARVAVVTLRKPHAEWEDQSVLMFAKDLGVSDATELGKSLDEAHENGAWYGNSVVQVFTNGFDLTGDPMKALLSFLDS
jgi:hypothetical protein